MKNLNSLLERFKKSLGDDADLKKEIVKCIENNTKIKLEEKNIFIKNGILDINTTPVKQNEIRMKEDRIIHFLNTERGMFINKIFYK